MDENGKPVWDDDIDIDDIVPDFDKHDEAYAPGGEAYDPTEAGTSGKKSRAERKKDKKKSKKGKGKDREEDNEDEVYANGGAAELDPEELDAIADPEERRRKIEQYMDEYYKLDYEDMVSRGCNLQILDPNLVNPFTCADWRSSNTVPLRFVLGRAQSCWIRRVRRSDGR